MLVIVALLFVAMIGMLGIALDGGRAYVERRSMQNAADAGALAAADKYWSDFQANVAQATAVSDAFSCGVMEFSLQTSSPESGNGTGPPGSACSTGGWSQTGGSVDSSACTKGAANESISYTDGSGKYHLTMTAIPATAANVFVSGLCIFNATSDDSIGAFFGVGTGIGTIPIGVRASAVSGHAVTLPTMLVLHTDCSQNAADWKVAGTSNMVIYGTAWSDGNIVDQATNGTNVTVNGDLVDHCDKTANISSHISVTGTKTGAPSAGILPDPLKSWPASVFNPACSTQQCTNPSGTDATSALDVELQPGKYSTTNSFGNGCWFLTPGIYDWANTSNSGSLIFNTHKTVLSNELTPPGTLNDSLGTVIPTSSTGQGTPSPNPSTNLDNENPAFSWTSGGQTCAGGVAVYPGTCGTANCGIPAGDYYFRFASVRHESAGWRESFPSSELEASGTVSALDAAPANNGGCIHVNVPSGTTDETLQFGISNVPGEGNSGDTSTDQYRIYATTDTAAGGCTAPASKFGFVESVGFTGTGLPVAPATHMTQQTTAVLQGNLPNPGTVQGCPYLPPAAVATLEPMNESLVSATQCTLGFVMSSPIDGITLGSKVSTPWTGSGTCSLGSTEAAQCEFSYLGYPLSPDGTQDAGNENQCVNSTGTCTDNPKGAGTTPGGVLMYFPYNNGNDTCISQTQGVPYMFGQLQLQSVIFYVEAPGTCNQKATVNGSDGGQFIGQVYIPTALLTVQGTGTPIDGGIVVWEIQTAGGANTTLTGRFPHQQLTTPGHLITCTTTGPVSTYCPPP